MRGRFWWTLEAVRTSWWFRLACFFVTAIGLWDLLGAQILPPTWAEKMPKVREFVAMTTGWIPLWGWTFILLLTLTALAFEFAYRANRASGPTKTITTVDSDLTSKRISWQSFKTCAEKEHDWDFGHYSNSINDLGVGLRQAAVDGVLVFEGRKGCTDVPKNLKDHFPLVKIPSEHFAEFDVYPFGEDNYDVQTYRPGHSHNKDGRYRDLHLGDKNVAVAWLRGCVALERN